MTKLTFVVVLIYNCLLLLSAQKNTSKSIIKIIDIEEFEDYYFIRAVECGDTISIISEKVDTICNFCDSIFINGIYELDLPKPAPFIGNISIKIKGKIVWQNDSFLGMPLLSKDLQGLYLIKEKEKKL